MNINYQFIFAIILSLACSLSVTIYYKAGGIERETHLKKINSIRIITNCILGVSIASCLYAAGLLVLYKILPFIWR